MTRIRIILVEPHEAGNLGAAARAMKNFGIDDLVLVGPDRIREDPAASWWAVGAGDLVERARRFDTLDEALRDCDLAVATTAAKNRVLNEQLTPSKLASVVSEQLGENHRLAVVFGPEERGLRRSEISRCQRIVAIPTHERFPTMNLAQSVAVICYELSKSLRPSPEPKDPAPVALLQHLDEHARHVMEAVNFFADRNRDRVLAELKAVGDRGGLSSREAATLLALIRRIEGRMGICVSREEESEPE